MYVYVGMHAQIILMKGEVAKTIWRLEFLNWASVNPLKLFTNLFIRNSRNHSIHQAQRMTRKVKHSKG